MTRMGRLASVLALGGLLGACQGSPAGGDATAMRVLQNGENHEVAYGDPRGNAVGGGVGRYLGGGESGEITYYGPVQSEPPLVARMVGGGEGATIVYEAAAPSEAAPMRAELVRPRAPRG